MPPVEAAPAMPAVEASPPPPRPAGQPGTGGAGTTRPDPVAWLIALATFAAYTTLSVARYRRLNPGSWDLGIYTQYVRQLAHLHAPVVAIRGPGFNLLGDHFQPIVAPVAPFFRLFPTPVTLLVAQALLTAVSVVPVCQAGAGNASRRACPPWRKAWAASRDAPAAPSRDRAAVPGPPGARAARYAAVAMAAIAALLAFRFPLAGLWSPRTYQVTPHVRAEREALALIPAGTTVESTLTMLAPLAARDGATWIGTAGNPVPRYVAYDADNSGYAHPPADVPGFINSRYPGVTYQTVFKADGVYLFRRIANG
jgi:hypothetical protein